jgi:hypothetical protein
MDSGRRDFSGLFGCWIKKEARGVRWSLCVYVPSFSVFFFFPELNHDIVLLLFQSKAYRIKIGILIKQFNIESAPY